MHATGSQWGHGFVAVERRGNPGKRIVLERRNGATAL